VSTKNLARAVIEAPQTSQSIRTPPFARCRRPLGGFRQHPELTLQEAQRFGGRPAWFRDALEGPIRLVRESA